MSKKFFLGLLLPAILFLGQALNAASGAGVDPTTPTELSCNLPGPTNLHTTQITPTTASIAWNAVSGAWGYSVELFDSGGLPVYAPGITTGTAWTFTGLTPGTDYTAKVYPMCSIVEKSTDFTALEFHTIIVEVVCQAKSCVPSLLYIGSPSPNNPQVNYTWLLNTQEIYFIWITTSSNETLRYEFEQVTSAGAFKIRPLEGNPSGYELGQRADRYCPYQGNTKEFYVVNSNGTVVSGVIGSGNITFPNIAANHSVTVYRGYCIAYPETPQNAADRVASDSDQSEFIRPLPNPFADVLTLNGSGGTPEAPVEIQLFDAAGRLVKREEAVIEGSYALSTADLPPGVYFLKLQSDAGSFVYKLLKM